MFFVKKMVCLIYTLTFFFSVQAGVDITGRVRMFQITNEALLWLLDGPHVKEWCSGGWAGLNMSIPRSDPQFPYYYGLISMAFAQNKKFKIYTANISALGTGPHPVCDISKTGYGLLITEEIAL